MYDVTAFFSFIVAFISMLLKVIYLEEKSTHTTKLLI